MREKKQLIRIGFVLAVGLGALLLLRDGESSEAPTSDAALEQLAAEVAAQESETSAQAPVSEPETFEPTTLREFTALEFKQTYDQLLLPNSAPITTPPEITGNSGADAAIRSAAEVRGYQVRSVASGLLNEFESIQLQELLIADWQDMRQAGLEAGVSMSIRSGYRAVADQRDIFVDRMSAAGITEQALIDGTVDQALDDILALTAPPGYSRHHSGYTIDLEDASSTVFDGSASELWLSADNYANAKRFGFIPSYPDGLEQQGPNPEPWEFVWVGTNITYQ